MKLLRAQVPATLAAGDRRGGNPHRADLLADADAHRVEAAAAVPNALLNVGGSRHGAECARAEQLTDVELDGTLAPLESSVDTFSGELQLTAESGNFADSLLCVQKGLKD